MLLTVTGTHWRLVRKIEPISPDNTEDLEWRSFDSFLPIPNLILLGDPGSGKTHTFKLAAKAEDGEFLTARQFLIYGETSRKGSIYVDALDEFRSRTDDANSVIEIVSVLRRLSPKKFRLSCRVADWLGQTDLQLFRKHFEENGGYAVVRLGTLTDSEIDAILTESSVAEPQVLRAEAEARGVAELLRNPQTLIMLAAVVGDGRWPETKRDLFRLATSLLLSEHGEEQIHRALGTYAPEELIEPAGAACAAMLISGEYGISLKPDGLSSGLPSYRQVPFPDPQRVLSALCRRAFVGLHSESVGYVHRTVAEFLAAQWLTDRITNGLPRARIDSLIGIEGHPASELRGLHAWLATLLADEAMSLISADPYGVLAYGDAASMSPSNRRALLKALEKLSTIDPWFRRQNWTSEPLGALSGPDMVQQFRTVLASPSHTSHFRSVVLDAIANGPRLPELLDDLIAVLINPAEDYYVRLASLTALLRTAPGGQQLAVDAFRRNLTHDPSSVRLRAEIVARLYEPYFGPSDVLSIFNELLCDTERHAFSELHSLAHSIPVSALAAVLDELSGLHPDEDFSGHRRNEFEIEASFSALLARALNSTAIPEASHLWHWLKALNRFRGGGGHRGVGKDEIREWLTRNSPSISAMLDLAIREISSEQRRLWFWHDFQRVTLGTIDLTEAARHIRTRHLTLDPGSEWRVLLYETALEITLYSEEVYSVMFDDLYDLAEHDSELALVRERLCQCHLSDWRQDQAKGRSDRHMERQRNLDANKKNFEEHRDSIRSGRHLGWLGFIARVYFSMFSDVDGRVSVQQRLEKLIGDDGVLDALEGLQAVLKRPDLPTPQLVVETSARSRVRYWWYAILAGMDESWADDPRLERFPSEALASAFAISVKYPTRVWEDNTTREAKRPWVRLLAEARPAWVSSVLFEMARIELSFRSDYPSALYELCSNPLLSSASSEFALKLLKEFPTSRAESLKRLALTAAAAETCRSRLIELAINTLRAPGRVRKQQRGIWMAVGLLLSFEEFRETVLRYVRNRNWALWIIRDIFEHARVDRGDSPYEMSIEQVEFLTTLFGERFPDTYPPEDGWSGSENAWDASELVRKGINVLSGKPDVLAGAALGRLIARPVMATYMDHLRHAIANQAAIRRQARYRQPTWHQTVEALKGGRPANVADLHALAVSQLISIREKIKNSNIDTYKEFWNEDSYGRILSPKPEESCRDRLVDMLRPLFEPLDIRVEPEGHMPADKSADIVLTPPPGQKLPLELKRDTHPGLWTACASQLERMYTKDIDAAGHGIYVVFWFGDKRSSKIASPPKGVEAPRSPVDLETSLRSLIPVDQRHCLDVVVLDVTPPSSPLQST